MPIINKPRKNNHANNALVNTIIEKGGSPPSQVKLQRKKNVTPIKLNIPTLMLYQIDSILDEDLVMKNRHSWILEAIVEKLKKRS